MEERMIVEEGSSSRHLLALLESLANALEVAMVKSR